MFTILFGNCPYYIHIHTCHINKQVHRVACLRRTNGAPVRRPMELVWIRLQVLQQYALTEEIEVAASCMYHSILKTFFLNVMFKKKRFNWNLNGLSVCKTWHSDKWLACTSDSVELQTEVASAELEGDMLRLSRLFLSF